MIVLWHFSWLLMMDAYSQFLQSDAELTWLDTYCIVNTTYWRLHCDFPAKKRNDRNYISFGPSKIIFYND